MAIPETPKTYRGKSRQQTHIGKTNQKKESAKITSRNNPLTKLANKSREKNIIRVYSQIKGTAKRNKYKRKGRASFLASDSGTFLGCSSRTGRTG